MVKDLMKTNCYDVDSVMLIAGTCLKNMCPKAYNKLEKMSNNIYEVCLEETHLNMVITKLIGMICRVKVSKIVFATVDKSPHCVQMHYIENEIRKAMDLSNTEIIHYVAVKDELIEISEETISKSKNLSLLESK